MRRWARLLGGELWFMLVVAGDAVLSLDGTKRLRPKTSRSTVNTRLPIAVGRTVTASAKRRAGHQLQFPPIPRLKQLQIRLIVTIETVVIPIVASVTHDDVLMFFGKDRVPIGTKMELNRLGFVVARVAVQPGRVATRPDDLCC